jgi:serine/threonine-protein kinase
MIALLLLLLAAGIAILAYELGHRDHKARPAPTKVAMPRVVGLDQRQALNRLRRRGLSATIVERATSKPTGTVAAQRPGAGAQVRRTSPVTLVVDAGSPRLTVPNLVGQPLPKAQATLTNDRLEGATTTVLTSSKPAGTVVDQTPKPGAKLAPGSLVTLSVAKRPPGQTTTTTTTKTTAQTTTTPARGGGTAAPAPTPRTATVPDVAGQSEDDAAHALAGSGILASIVFVPSDDQLGTVERQAKPSGTTVAYHSHVQINVSSGPNASTTEQVPRVIGSTLQQAVTTLNRAHLRLIYVELAVPRAQAGRVVQQSPLPGGRAPKNAQVLVFLGAFKG